MTKVRLIHLQTDQDQEPPPILSASQRFFQNLSEVDLKTAFSIVLPDVVSLHQALCQGKYHFEITLIDEDAAVLISVESFECYYFQNSPWSLGFGKELETLIIAENPVPIQDTIIITVVDQRTSDS